jgi:hypothetical protein
MAHHIKKEQTSETTEFKTNYFTGHAAGAGRFVLGTQQVFPQSQQPSGDHP